MATVVCTLFEKHYHFGLAALVNSLYRHGYRGPIYAGYKGALPFWSTGRKDNPQLGWLNASTMVVAEGLEIHFLPIESEFHLSLYKSYYMEELFNTVAIDADGIAYFDPDIVIKFNWKFFETWMTNGVALVDENITRPANHPTRKEWEKVIEKINRKTVRGMNTYLNGGFCGVSKQNIEFVKVWSQVTDAGIKYFNLNPAKWIRIRDNSYAFFNLDQDALNITAMCCDTPISEIGPEGMDFIPGGFTMSHAFGQPKPWRKRFVRSALKGQGPSLADKAYWVNVTGPIQLYGRGFLKVKALKLTVASFIGRFYRRA
jgi:hypothetical protein